MSFPRQHIIDRFLEGGTPAWVFSGGFTLPDMAFESCDEAFVQAAYDDLLDMLPPECVTTRQVPGTDKTIRHLRHTMDLGDTQNEAGDCDTHGLVFTGHCAIGNWKKAIRTGTRRGGLALGFVDFINTAKDGDPVPAGGHDRNWFIHHDGSLRWFEAGWNAFLPLVRADFESIFAGRAV